MNSKFNTRNCVPYTISFSFLKGYSTNRVKVKTYLQFPSTGTEPNPESRNSSCTDFNLTKPALYDVNM